MLKKLLPLLGAAWSCFLPLVGAEAKTVLDMYSLGVEEEELRPVDFTLNRDGPLLLFSDSPEMVYQDGLLYRDQVQGRVRLFFHHVNAQKQQSKLAVLVKNTQALRPLELKVLQQGISKPCYDWIAAGKQAQKLYFGGQKQQEPRKLGGERSVELLNGRGCRLEPDQLVTGMVDLELSAPAEISMLMCRPQTDVELFNASARQQPLDEHPLRGTFAKADYHYVLTSPFKPKDKSMYVLKLAAQEDMARGKDATTGLPAINNGNYGVIYTVDFEIKGEEKMRFLLNSLGGIFSGYGLLQQEGKSKLVGLPKEALMGKHYADACELGQLGKGRYRFIWSPPGSSNLPIRLLWQKL